MWGIKKYYKNLRAKTIKSQACMFNLFKYYFFSHIFFQKDVRMWIARRLYLKVHDAAVTLQSCKEPFLFFKFYFDGYLVALVARLIKAKNYVDKIRLAITLQSMCRGFLARQIYHSTKQTDKKQKQKQEEIQRKKYEDEKREQEKRMEELKKEEERIIEERKKLETARLELEKLKSEMTNKNFDPHYSGMTPFHEIPQSSLSSSNSFLSRKQEVVDLPGTPPDKTPHFPPPSPTGSMIRTKESRMSSSGGSNIMKKSVSPKVNTRAVRMSRMQGQFTVGKHSNTKPGTGK